jgi:hypothetical protein
MVASRACRTTRKGPIVKEKSRPKWQQGLSEFLEPDERVEAAVRGIRAKFWQMVLVVGWLLAGTLRLYRTYAVTDRNVYVFRASFVSKYKVTELLEKRPLAEARVEFRRGYLTLNGSHESFVAAWGPGKRWALEVAQAANRAPVPAATAEPKLTTP